MKCTILEGRTVRSRGKFHEAGAELELPEAEAQRLVDLGYVRAATPPPAPAPVVKQKKAKG